MTQLSIDEEAVIEYYQNSHTQSNLDGFMIQVRHFFDTHPDLTKCEPPIIHSVRSRFKDPSHLIDKIRRKKENGKIITKDTLLRDVNDLIGIRVLHLYQDQFKIIHNEIVKKVEVDEDWRFVEKPKAYTWDPESEVYFKTLGIETELKDSYYTSVHYVVTANNKSEITCEIQVRTLFEEIWGEIDHSINYPHETDNKSCKEQLRVLSKLVSTGTRLADSIFRSYHNDY